MDEDWTQALEREFDRIQPRELLVPEPAPVPISLLQQPPGTFNTMFQAWERAHFRRERAYNLLTRQFGVHTLEGFGCEDNELAIAASGALLAYVQSTQQATLNHLQGLRFYSTSDFMVLEETTRQHLELVQSAWLQKRTGSLLDVMDMTVTAMGGRLLRQWLSQPLYVLQPLRERQGAVAELVEQSTVRAKLRQALAGVADLERIVGRLSFGSISPRDLVALRRSIQALPAVEALVCRGQGTWFIERTVQWDSLVDIESRIAQTIVEEPPASLRDGLVIRPGYNAELDALRDADASGKDWLSAFETQERERTGINALRIGFNKVFGYYIEVRKTHAEKVPDTYTRKQTLVNAERFITPDLKEHEVRMLRAGEHATRLEQELYDVLRQALLQHTARLQQMAHLLSQLDVLASLAELAVARQYCRPTLDLSDRLDITDGRHPVLETTYQDERFVPNDTQLDCETNQILLLTGPNMAGKSTYMRQVALIVIMAQMGSFVPASAAHIGLVDRVFTRVGAQDLLAKGQSTFMVEMVETANILHNVGPRSLVLLDEIGRGTSTYDGISIAWAVVEYLHQYPAAHPRTLFATHYHELTALATILERVHNFNAAVHECGEQITFLRKILAGRADRSYGIQVARLAGLPPTVIERARQLLAQFESADSRQAAVASVQTRTAAVQRQLSLFDNASDQLLQELRTLAIDDLSPREALNALAALQQRAKRLP
jgi:DNA mismatch repair protein MutS